MCFVCTPLKRRPSFYVDKDDDDDDDGDDNDDNYYKRKKLADADCVRYMTKQKTTSYQPVQYWQKNSK